MQDHARAADAPDEIISEAADLVEKVSALLAPYEADEWHAPSGRRLDLPNRGNIMSVPMDLHVTAEERVAGTVAFRRYHLGRNGAVHGGVLGLLFDSLLGYTTAKLTRSMYQRTAHLGIDYRKIVPIGTPLQVEAGIDRIDGRKMYVSGRLLAGPDVLTEADALFIRLKPGQP